MFSCLFSDNMAQDSAKIEKGCGSSVVEHSLGKGEVESSILSRSTILFFFCLSLLALISLPYKPKSFPQPSSASSNPPSFKPCASIASKSVASKSVASKSMASKSRASMTRLISKMLCERLLKLTAPQRISPHPLPPLSFLASPLFHFCKIVPLYSFSLPSLTVATALGT